MNEERLKEMDEEIKVFLTVILSHKLVNGLSRYIIAMGDDDVDVYFPDQKEVHTISRQNLFYTLKSGGKCFFFHFSASLDVYNCANHPRKSGNDFKQCLRWLRWCFSGWSDFGRPRESQGT